ncbi:MAG: TRAP transporter substrate-binding protein [Mailhella sp.]|nr:TRAP transporter substrate-binding protein [Mailhella sp.]
MRLITTALLAAALFLGAPVCADAAITLKAAYTNVEEHPQADGYALFKKLVEERSKGDIKIELYGSGKFGYADAIMQGLQMGVLTIGGETPGNYSVYDPSIQVLDLPYLFPSYEAAERFFLSKEAFDLTKAFEKKGVTLLGFQHLGYRTIFSNRPVATLEDAKGLKIRTTASRTEIETIKSLGMNPTPMAWGEVYTALQQKTIDGINIDINLAYVNKFHEVCKYVTLSNNNYAPLMIFVSNRQWKKLNADQQKLIKEAFDESLALQRKIIFDNAKVLQKKMEEAGVKFFTLSDEELARWKKATSTVGETVKDIVPLEKQEYVKSLIK